MTGAAPRSRGFTLLEVLIAFTIAAIALVSLVQAFATGLRQVDRVDAVAIATLFAESKLSELEAAQELNAGENSGEVPGGGTWYARVTPRPLGAGPLTAYDIQVAVEFGGAVTRLDTIRLGPGP